MIELKPCPECGYDKTPPSYHHVPGRVHYLLCPACGYSVWGDRDTDNIAELWNGAQPANEPLTLDKLREHYITCHDCADAEYSRTITCGYVCRSKSSPCRGRVTVGYDFCAYGHRKPERSESDA